MNIRRVQEIWAGELRRLMVRGVASDLVATCHHKIPREAIEDMILKVVTEVAEKEIYDRNALDERISKIANNINTAIGRSKYGAIVSDLKDAIVNAGNFHKYILDLYGFDCSDQVNSEHCKRIIYLRRLISATLHKLASLGMHDAAKIECVKRLYGIMGLSYAKQKIAMVAMYYGLNGFGNPYGNLYDFMCLHISNRKVSTFFRVAYIRNRGSSANVRILCYWLSVLSKELGLAEYITTEYDPWDDDPYDNDPSAFIREFYEEFTYEMVVSTAAKKISKNRVLLCLAREEISKLIRKHGDADKGITAMYKSPDGDPEHAACVTEAFTEHLLERMGLIV